MNFTVETIQATGGGLTPFCNRIHFFLLFFEIFFMKFHWLSLNEWGKMKKCDKKNELFRRDDP